MMVGTRERRGFGAVWFNRSESARSRVVGTTARVVLSFDRAHKNVFNKR
jgi:hypothetical protein